MGAEKGKGFRVACVSQFDQLYVGGHGDFNPACSASTETVTPRPIVGQPEEDVVSDAAWATLTAADVAENVGFVHKIELDEVAGNTVLLWKSVADVGMLHAKMLHRGYVGWMALGLANLEDKVHNGMNGGRIVMAQNNPDRKAPQGGPLSVGEYMIDPRLSAYRHWQTPLSVSEPNGVSLQNASFTMENGASILEFRAKAFYKKALNLTSANTANTFIWALTQNAYCTAEYGGYCAYHSDAQSNRSRRPEFRGVINLDLVDFHIRENTESDSNAAMPQGLRLVQAAAQVMLSATLFLML